MRAPSAGRERGAWIAIGAAILGWGAAEVYWTAAILDAPSPPYPSPADIGYLAFYPLAALGLVLLVRARARELNWQLWMDGVIAAPRNGGPRRRLHLRLRRRPDHRHGAAGRDHPRLSARRHRPRLARVGVVALTSWRPGRAWTLLLAGFARWPSPTSPTRCNRPTSALPEGVWVDPLYLIAACCLGAEAWQFRDERDQCLARFEGWRELIVPGVFAAVMIGLFAMQYSEHQQRPRHLALGGDDDRRDRPPRDQRPREQAAPGAGADRPADRACQPRRHAGRPRDRCGQATAEQPIAVLLFDLNGFKRYNDTFGHPAGDELLPSSATHCARRSATTGIAYRFGGDEFCVLLTCAGESFDALSRERGDGPDRSAERASTSPPPGARRRSRRGRRAARGDAARRRPHVRAEGVAPRRPRL